MNGDRNTNAARALPRRTIVVLAIALAASATTGAVAAAFFSGPLGLTRGVQAKDAPPFQLQGPRAGLLAGSSRVVRSFTASNGDRHQVVIAASKDSKELCLMDVNLDTRDESGGCNPAGNFFGGRQLFVSLAYDGGPAISNVRGARIVGLVSSAVASVVIVDSDGRRAAVRLSADGAFSYDVPAEDLSRGVEPKVVVAYNAAGHEVDRQETGITS
jgi:hypothetical protein